jgi:type IV secretion system protein VirB11
MSAQPLFVEEDDRDRADREAALDSYQRFLKLLGPLRKHLIDPDVPTYNVNVGGGDAGRVFVETAAGKFEASETMSRDNRKALISYIATKSATAITAQQSRLSADMPHGLDMRVQAFCPPADDWTLMIRVHAAEVIPLERYVERGQMTSAQHAALQGIAGFGNIPVVGRLGSGKTTFLNALLLEVARKRKQSRLVIVQDRKELKPSHRDYTSILAGIPQSRYVGGKRHEYTYEFHDAIKDALRSDADCIAIGEVRDYESTSAMLNGLNKGMRGCLATWHANSAVDGLYAIEDLLRFGGWTPPRRMIARLFDAIVVMGMDDNRDRRVQEVALVHGVDAADEYVLEAVA